MQLKEAINYDPETGVFTWSVTRGFVKRGTKAGCVINGRTYITFEGKRIPCHRLAWSIMTGAELSDKIRYKNKDALDNRWANLYNSAAAQGFTLIDETTGRALHLPTWLEVIEHVYDKYGRDQTT